MNKEGLLYSYFSNTLSPEEKAAFNQLLETDTAFKEEFEFQLKVKQATQYKSDQELAIKLKSFETKIVQKEQVKKKSFPFLKIAASILLLCAASWFVFNGFSKTNEELYASNFTTYPNADFTITRSDTINSIEREAFVAYERGDYQEAFSKLSKAPKNTYTDFYKAQSLINLNRLPEAEVLLTSIIETNIKYTAESLWYLALIKVKEENNKEAVILLKKLTAGYDYKKKQASSILQELN